MNRRQMAAVVLTAAAWTGVTVVTAASPPGGTQRRTGPTPAQRTALKRVTAAVEAMGGAARLDGVSRLEVVSRGTRRLPNGADVEATTVVRIAFPERYRQDVTLPMGHLTTVVNGGDAFMIVDGTTVPLPKGEREAQMQAIHRSLLGLLRNRHDPDNPPTPAGRKSVDGRPMSLVRLGADPAAPTLAVDPASGFVREISYATQLGGRPGRFAITYSDYRAVGDLKYPFKSEGTFDGKPVFSSTVEKVVFDPPLEEALFNPPAPSPAPVATPPAG